MTIELFTTSVVSAANFIATYLLHSTLLLTTVALATLFSRSQSHSLSERLWKSAAVIPLLTAPLQLWGGLGTPILFSSDWAIIRDEIQKPRVDGNDRANKTIDVSKSDSGEVEVGGESISLASDSAIPETSDVVVTKSDVDVQLIEPAKSSSLTADLASLKAYLNENARDVEALEETPILAAVVIPRPAAWPSRSAICVVGAFSLVVLFGIVRVLVMSFRFARVVRSFRKISSGAVHSSLRKLTKRAGLRRRIRLLQTSQLSEPIAFGIFNWTIVVPDSVQTRLDSRELEAMLAHELAHLVRGDARWLLVGRLLCGCLPLQPLNFVARLRWRQAAEYQCDDWAVERTRSPLALARCLTFVAEWRLNADVCPHALSAGGGASTLLHRIERLLASEGKKDPWRLARGRRFLTAATLSVALLLMWGGPRTTLLAHFADTPLAAELSTEVAQSERDMLLLELERLADELEQLEPELSQLHELLDTNGSNPELDEIATRLSSRVTQMFQRRFELDVQVDAALRP